MKKIIIMLFLVNILFFGCTNNIILLTGALEKNMEIYKIKQIKNMKLNEGITLEEYINIIITLGETYYTNKELIKDDLDLILLGTDSTEENKYIDRKIRKLTNQYRKIDWKVEEITEEEVFYIVESEHLKISFKTLRMGMKEIFLGDYILIDSLQDEKYQEIEKTLKFLELLLSNKDLISNYDSNNTYKKLEEYTELSIKILKNENNEYKIEYYPSGRIKFLKEEFNDVEMKDGDNFSNISEKVIEFYYLTMTENLMDGMILGEEIEYMIAIECINQTIYPNKIKNKKIDKLKKLHTSIYNLNMMLAF